MPFFVKFSPKHLIFLTLLRMWLFSFLFYLHCCCCLVAKSCLTRLPPHGKPVAHQSPLFMEFPRQVYWSGLPFPTPEDILDPGMEPVSPALAGRFFTTWTTWEAYVDAKDKINGFQVKPRYTFLLFYLKDFTLWLVSLIFHISICEMGLKCILVALDPSSQSLRRLCPMRGVPLRGSPWPTRRGAGSGPLSVVSVRF